MCQDIGSAVAALARRLGQIEEVHSVGRSRGEREYPQPGAGDVDLFLYCDAVPSVRCRSELCAACAGLLEDARVGVLDGSGHWGFADRCRLQGVEVWLLFFTMEQTLAELAAILRGDYPDKLDNYYYPTGRCAMLQNMEILYDVEGFLADQKQRLSQYPETLRQILLEYHLAKLADTEDLERAVALSDVLFYHFALDLALDHLLQTLFALNRAYFPSRKRSVDIAVNFASKPDAFQQRILKVVQLGGGEDGLETSYLIYRDLVNELRALCGQASLD